MGGKVNPDHARNVAKVRLGELLVQKGLLTPPQLKQALATQQGTRQKLGELLIQQRVITRPQLTKALAEQFLKNLSVTVVLSASTVITFPQMAIAQISIRPSSNPKKLQNSSKPGWVKWQVSSRRVDLRSEPSKQATILANLRPGRRVQIIEAVTSPEPTQPRWYKVESQGKQGFVAAEAIAAFRSQDADQGSLLAYRDQTSVPQALRGFCHPLQGEGIIVQAPNQVTTHLGRMKYAFDFAIPLNQPVYAMDSGRVVGLQDRFPDTGGGKENFSRFNYVLIEHKGGFHSAYLHLHQGFKTRVGIKVGDRVAAGQLIGYSGNSGWSTGPHLHVEVHRAVPNGTFGQTIPFEISRLCEIDPLP